MAAETRKPNKNEAMEALEDICAKYTLIRKQNVERFVPVYYPIAIVELCLEEETFEDFETVQLAVLRLVNLGISDPEVIAKTLSLTGSYIQRVLHLLTGYGHIVGGAVTELGWQSLNRGQKIVLNRTIQKFQMDALNGTLLKVGQAVTENALNDKSQTRLAIAHMNYLDGVSTQTLSNQLVSANSGAYLHHKSDILHSNVRAITDAQCTQLQYAAGYMMKLRGQQMPIVMAKRYDRSKKDMKDRFSWQPFSVQNRQVIGLCGFEENTTISMPYANSYVQRLYALMEEESQKKDLRQEAVTAVSKLYHVELEKIKFLGSDGIHSAVVEIGDDVLERYRGNLLPLLMGMATDGEYIVTNEYLLGHLVSVRTNSSKLKKLGKLLAEKVEAVGRSAVNRTLRERLQNYQEEEPLVDTMIQIVQSM